MPRRIHRQTQARRGKLGGCSPTPERYRSNGAIAIPPGSSGIHDTSNGSTHRPPRSSLPRAYRKARCATRTGYSEYHWSTRGRGSSPLRSFEDELTIESTVLEFGRSSFQIRHRLLKNSDLAVEGFETRVWAVRHPNDPQRLRSEPIPPEVIARFQDSN